MNTTWTQRNSLKTVTAYAALFGFLLSPMPFVTASAQTSSSDTIAQNFGTETDSKDFIAGVIVTNTPNKENIVNLATLDNIDRIIGVVDTSPLVSLSSGDKKIPVVLAGTTSVLVSDINGTIKSGDKITASPIVGVGMLATSDGKIIGTAQADFRNNTGDTKQITDKNGKQHIVRIQKIPVQVGIAYYNAPGSDFLPPVIQDIANTIAGRPVSLLRILFGITILFIGLAYAIIMTYSSTRSMMAALGRNPLGSKQIMRGQYRAVITAFIVIGCTLLATYLILVV